MTYKEPHTHPIKPTLRRNEVDKDVLELAAAIRDILRNEELWYVLQVWKERVQHATKREIHDAARNLQEQEEGPWHSAGWDASGETYDSELPPISFGGIFER